MGDPNHAVTWPYYGMWQAEQGNVLKAKDDLEEVRLICGNTDCRPYKIRVGELRERRGKGPEVARSATRELSIRLMLV